MRVEIKNGSAFPVARHHQGSRGHINAPHGGTEPCIKSVDIKKPTKIRQVYPPWRYIEHNKYTTLFNKNKLKGGVFYIHSGQNPKNDIWIMKRPDLSHSLHKSYFFIIQQIGRTLIINIHLIFPDLFCFRQFS